MKILNDLADLVSQNFVVLIDFDQEDLFIIKNLDKIHHYLGMKMIYDCQWRKIHLSQKQYI